MEETSIEEAAAEAAVQPKKRRRIFTKENIAAFFTIERMLGIVAVLIIPCLLAAWVRVPVASHVGLDLSFSMPQTLSTASSLVSTAEDVQDITVEVEKYAAIAKSAIGIAADVYSQLDAVIADKSGETMKALVADVTEDIMAITAADYGAVSAGDVIENEQAAEAIDAAVSFDLGPIKALLTAATVLWYLFAALLLVSAILLIGRLRGRYALSIVSFALVAILSLAFIIGIGIADQAIVDALAGMTGAWLTLILPSIISVTAWPWIILIVSIACIVFVALCKARPSINPLFVAAADADAGDAEKPGEAAA